MFTEFFTGSMMSAVEMDWDSKVEVLQLSVALMSQEYAMATIKIYVLAVSHYFFLHGLAPPWE